MRTRPTFYVSRLRRYDQYAVSMNNENNHHAWGYLMQIFAVTNQVCNVAVKSYYLVTSCHRLIAQIMKHRSFFKCATASLACPGYLLGLAWVVYRLIKMSDPTDQVYISIIASACRLLRWKTLPRKSAYYTKAIRRNDIRVMSSDGSITAFCGHLSAGIVGVVEKNDEANSMA